MSKGSRIKNVKGSRVKGSRGGGSKGRKIKESMAQVIQRSKGQEFKGSSSQRVESQPDDQRVLHDSSVGGHIVPDVQTSIHISYHSVSIFYCASCTKWRRASLLSPCRGPDRQDSNSLVLVCKFHRPLSSHRTNSGLCPSKDLCRFSFSRNIWLIPLACRNAH